MNRLLKLVRGTRACCADLARELAGAADRRTLPRLPRSDDVYLVSFPKSGVTWMSFLVANVNIALSGGDRPATFYNIHQYVPDIQQSRELGPPLLPRPGFRFIKSHALLNPGYCQVLYVVRDPADALVSYHHFLRGQGAFDGSLSELVRSPRHGIARWVEHVDGWIARSPASLRFMMTRYEDLLRDPAAELAGIYRQLGFDVPPDVLARAVEASSFDSMRRQELGLAYGGRALRETFRFVRGGRSGDGAATLSADDRALIAHRAGPWLERLGYAA